MPDPTKQTISASQAPALFGQSPYNTRWMLWQAFKNALPIEPPEDQRMGWGKLLQHVILRATADQYRLEMQPNLEDRYERRGRLGCTIDGHLIAPDQGEIVVEAKNVDWLRWKDTWTETAAPPHVEIQLQQQLLVRDCPRGIIACFVGGNQILFYEREANPAIWQSLQREADAFFASLEANEEPDVLASPLELPALAYLYPVADPVEVLEDMTDLDLTETIRQYAYARDQAKFFERVEDQMKAKLLARAKSAGLVRAHGVKAFITKSPIRAQMCEPHAVPKQLRKPSIQTRIRVEAVDDGAAPGSLEEFIAA